MFTKQGMHPIIFGDTKLLNKTLTVVGTAALVSFAYFGYNYFYKDEAQSSKEQKNYKNEVKKKEQKQEFFKQPENKFLEEVSVDKIKLNDIFDAQLVIIDSFHKEPLTDDEKMNLKLYFDLRGVLIVKFTHKECITRLTGEKVGVKSCNSYVTNIKNNSSNDFIKSIFSGVQQIENLKVITKFGSKVKVPGFYPIDGQEGSILSTVGCITNDFGGFAFLTTNFHMFKNDYFYKKDNKVLFQNILNFAELKKFNSQSAKKIHFGDDKYSRMNRGAVFCDLIYEQENDIKTKLKEKSFKQINGSYELKEVPTDSKNGYHKMGIFESDDEVIFCFRGTEMKHTPDLLADLNVWNCNKDTIVIPEIGDLTVKFHSGFYNRACEFLNLNWKKYFIKKKHILIVGHSLGGAAAQIFTFCNLFPLMKKKDIDEGKKYHCVTYGAPMAGNDWFPKFIDEYLCDVFEPYVNCLDPIPRLPKYPLIASGIYQALGTITFTWNYWGGKHFSFIPCPLKKVHVLHFHDSEFFISEDYEFTGNVWAPLNGLEYHRIKRYRAIIEMIEK
eukprot:gene5504-9321_t